MRSLDIASTGMLAQQRNVEVISNNLANMNTTAYQRRRTEFHDLIYQDMRRAGSTSSDAGNVVPTGVQLGLGVKLAAVYRIHEQGNLTATDNTFDLAIQGKGFFQVLLPTGETAYTRDGTFQLNQNGKVVTHDGYVLQPALNHSAKRHRCDDQRIRSGSGKDRWTDRAAECRPDYHRYIPERARPAGNR